jgi:hypothetical protein
MFTYFLPVIAYSAFPPKAPKEQVHPLPDAPRGAEVCTVENRAALYFSKEKYRKSIETVENSF